MMARHFGRRMYSMRNDRPFISFTFDDFPISAFTTGGGILERYGLAGTFYASMGLMGQDAPAGRLFSAPEVRALLAARHEVGCHTFSHRHSWSTPAREFEESIIENGRALKSLLPGESFKTMSYPISCPRPTTKRSMGKYFSCCRGGGQGFNVGKIDLNYLNAFFLEQCEGSREAVREIIEKNCQANGWLILATHDVGEKPSKFGCTQAFFEEIVQYAAQSGAAVLPVDRAWEAIRSMNSGG
jgi:peptidoglycan/xylan/chitin deacetylase (PgdA/CDA1 family)